MKCEDCKWSKEKVIVMGGYGSAAATKTKCHVNPPTEYGFPTVELDDYCGKFEPKEKE